METQTNLESRGLGHEAPRRVRRGKLGLWFRRLENLRAAHPQKHEFLESAHRLLRWSAIERDVDLYVAVRGMIRSLASERP